MSETKFTPAPWVADSYDIISTSSEGDVCVATTVNADLADAVNIANARLIAVAPEIYDLLKEVEEEFEHEAKQKYYGYCNPSLQYKISKVLAKAKGDNE